MWQGFIAMPHMDRQLSIFMADDDLDEQHLFKMALNLICVNAQVEFSSDGFTLLEKLEMYPTPDLIFLDINMPVMNGHKCLEQIRTSEKFKNIPVIMYSTSNYASDINTAYANGATHYLCKPSVFRDLEKLLMQICHTDFTTHVRTRENFLLKV